MKELDVLLERFVDLSENLLERGEWPEFEDLLQAEDDVLWDWLQQPQKSAPPRFHPILQRIRRGP